mmetsp:Transcript_71274/g.202174  ORF Transcript_71274/g.202174 Transcript_71274/m.202174 type:complete len:216 (-) Transcript_71274:310-957(-)
MDVGGRRGPVLASGAIAREVLHPAVGVAVAQEVLADQLARGHLGDAGRGERDHLGGRLLALLEQRVAGALDALDVAEAREGADQEEDPDDGDPHADADKKPDEDEKEHADNEGGHASQGERHPGGLDGAPLLAQGLSCTVREVGESLARHDICHRASKLANHFNGYLERAIVQRGFLEGDARHGDTIHRIVRAIHLGECFERERIIEDRSQAARF